jgi:hypothetical protein
MWWRGPASARRTALFTVMRVAQGGTISRDIGSQPRPGLTTSTQHALRGRVALGMHIVGQKPTSGDLSGQPAHPFVRVADDPLPTAPQFPKRRPDTVTVVFSRDAHGGREIIRLLEWGWMPWKYVETLARMKSRAVA